jgi:hypothetical protein
VAQRIDFAHGGRPRSARKFGGFWLEYNGHWKTDRLPNYVDEGHVKVTARIILHEMAEAERPDEVWTDIQDGVSGITIGLAIYRLPTIGSPKRLGRLNTVDCHTDAGLAQLERSSRIKSSSETAPTLSAFFSVLVRRWPRDHGFTASGERDINGPTPLCISSSNCLWHVVGFVASVLGGLAKRWRHPSVARGDDSRALVNLPTFRVRRLTYLTKKPPRSRGCWPIP